MIPLKIDPKTAQNVWNRVQNTPAPVRDARIIAELLQSTLTDAQVCRQLWGTVSEKHRPALRAIQLQLQSHIHFLQGICILLTGDTAPLQAAPPEKEPASIALRRFFGRLSHRLSLSQPYLGDPQLGPVCIHFTRQLQELSFRVLELMGNV